MENRQKKDSTSIPTWDQWEKKTQKSLSNERSKSLEGIDTIIKKYQQAKAEPKSFEARYKMSQELEQTIKKWNSSKLSKSKEKQSKHQHAINDLEESVKMENEWLAQERERESLLNKLKKIIILLSKELVAATKSIEELPKEKALRKYINSILSPIRSQGKKINTASTQQGISLEDISKLTTSAIHLSNLLKFRLNEISINPQKDSELEKLAKDPFALQLHKHEMKIDSQENGLGVVNLFGGGLPSEVANIIGQFYSNEFDVKNHYETGDEKTILAELVEEEEKKIKEAENKNQVKKNKRKFGNGKDEEQREILREQLRGEARKAAERRTVTPKSGGSLRSWHLNDTGNLPRTVLQGQHNHNGSHTKAGKISKGFSREGKEAKKLIKVESLTTDAQKALHTLWLNEAKEGIGFQPGYISDFPKGKTAFRTEATQIEPGYIEVNPKGWTEAESQGRLLYDYLEDRWFLTTDHYNAHFWEIYVPTDFKKIMSTSDKVDDTSVTTYTNSKASVPINDSTIYQLHDVNNCLIHAIHDAANRSGFVYPAPNVQQIRERLQDHNLGDIGEMLYADQAVVEVILEEMGIKGQHAVILYDANGGVQDVGGGGDILLEIYHTGALHYIGYPVTDAQKNVRKGVLNK